MKKKTYDLFDWTSFPSSLKCVIDERGHVTKHIDTVSINPGDRLKISCQVKAKNVESGLFVKGKAGNIEGRIMSNSKRVGGIGKNFSGTFSWKKLLDEETAPSGATRVILYVNSGGTRKGKAISKFDDFKFYVNGEVVVRDKFDPLWNFFGFS